jgi:hypothetical protein
VTVEWDDANKETAVTIYSNNQEKGAGRFPGPVMDDPNYQHLVGAEMNWSENGPILASFFHGFIWSLCVDAYKRTDFSNEIFGGDCGTGYCTSCPGDPEACLIDCEFDEWLDGDGVC